MELLKHGGWPGHLVLVLLLAAAFVLSTAVAFFGPGADAQGKKAAPRGALTVKVAGVAKGSAVQITISGPRQKGKAFKKTISTAGVKGFRGLALGRYRVSAKASQVGEGLATPSKAQQALTLSKKKSKGTVTVTYTVQAATPSPPAPAQPTPATPGGGTTPPADTAQPLRFSVAGAVGLATTQEVTGSTRARNGATAPESNLQAVYSSGQVTNAISSGRAKINDFVAGPDGKLYVTFNPPVNLEDPVDDPGDVLGPENGCVHAVVNPSNGVPTCLDPALDYLRGPGDPNLEDPLRKKPVQFDDRGNVFYTGEIGFGNDSYIVLRRKAPDGSITDLINPNIYLWNFLVLSDDSVLIQGYSRGGLNAYNPWLRRITPGNSLQELASGSTSYMFRFTDGNVYVGGVWSFGGPPSRGLGVLRYDVDDALLEESYWIGSNSMTPPSPQHDATSLCPPASDAVPRFCDNENYGANASQHIQTPNGRDFLIARQRWASNPHVNFGNLIQVYPSLAAPPTEVAQVRAATNIGNDLVVAGLNGANEEVVTVFDSSTNQEGRITGLDPGLEVNDLEAVTSEDKVMFTALRVSDNSYVIGEIDVASNTGRILGEVEEGWSDFESIR